jgi:hypothetical protein
MILRGLFDPQRRSARRRACSCLRSHCPNVTVEGARLRAAEPERWVFAVFYSDPDRPIRPAPYKLIAVERDTGAVSMLDTSPDSPYWYHGRR